MPPIRRFRVGALDLAVVSDGYIRLDAGAIMGVIPRVMWEPVVGPAAVDAENRMPLALNCLVVRSGDRVLIVDTGMGKKHDARVRERMFPGDYGHLPSALAALGLQSTEVTDVANTHLHTDHCGGNTTREGDRLVATFPRARYFALAAEYAEARQPNERTRGTYFAENFEPLEASGQLSLVEGEHEIIPGVHFLPTPGHTASHASVVLTSGGETAIYLGDLVHHAVQLERLAWIPAFDVLPLISLETKRTLVERAIRERALLVSTHLEFPGAGRLDDATGRPRWTPA